MKLVVRNICKIAGADLRLDGITVVIGNNNMGKSTLGKVLYTTLDAMTGLAEGIFDARVNYILRTARAPGYPYMRRLFRPADFMLPSIGEDELLRRMESSPVFSTRSVGRLRLTLESEKQDPAVLAELAGRLADAFGKSRTISDEDLAHDVLTQRMGDYFNNQFLPKYLGFHDESVVELEAIGSHVRSTWGVESPSLKLTAVPMVNSWFVGSPYVLDAVSNPSRRLGGIALDPVHRKVVAALRRPSSGSLVARRVTADELEPVFDLFKKPVADRFSVLEDGSLGYMSENLTEPLSAANLSMGLKTFSVLRLMLERNVLRAGDAIVLDEPENHLHPAYQMLFAHIVVLLQRIYHLTILLTTHSPYFMQAIELYSRRYAAQAKEKATLSVYHPVKADSLGRVVFEDITDNMSEIYRKFAGAMRELDQLRSEVEDEEKDGEND